MADIDPPHLDTRSLEAGLPDVRRSPAGRGTLRLIVCRPAVDERVELDEARLDRAVGLIGDNWRDRGNGRTVDGRSDPDRQVTLTNATAATLIAGSADRRALFGDQLYVDLDLSESNLPSGSRLVLGDAVLEITAAAHTGCAKFAARFGRDALRFVNSPEGRALRLRGANAKVIEGGSIGVGDAVRRLGVTPP